MDIDAVLSRRPQVALVDELAHTNIPGSRNEKRWQDIHELLDAGIDVISTVNIQHLESLNDAVTAITGIVQQETVPDEVVRAADQIDLVDMSPEALRRRMAHGNVYRPEKVDAALANYFRVGNLSALRELALLWLAEKVDAGLEGYRATHGITEQWPTRERVVVALSGGPEGEALLRRGARIASRLAGGLLLAVLVSRTDGLANAPLSQVAELRRLTEELGGEFHTVTGDDAAHAVLDFARAVNATQVLVGAPRLPLWQRGFAKSMAEKIIADAGDIDVHVVPHPSATGRAFLRRRVPRTLPRRRVWAGTVTALILPPLLTWLLLADPYTSELPLDIPIFLLVTVVVALIGGMVPAVVAAVISSLLLNWFFVEPVGTLTVANPENTIALVVFVLVGVLVALIVHRNAARRAEAQEAQRESAALVELSHSLLGRPTRSRCSCSGRSTCSGSRPRRSSTAQPSVCPKWSPPSARSTRSPPPTTRTPTPPTNSPSSQPVWPLTSVDSSTLSLRTPGPSCSGTNCSGPPRRRPVSSGTTRPARRCCPPSRTTCGRRWPASRPRSEASAPARCAGPRRTRTS